MKRNLIFILIFTMIIGTSCAQDDDIHVVNIPTAATTGALYPLGSSLASLLNNNIANLKASAQASNGGIDNLNLLQSGDAQISFAVTSIIHEAVEGINTFDGRPNDDIRIITGLYYNPNQVVVRNDSNINSLKDLKGKKFASGAPGSTTEVETDIHLNALGINYPDDLKTQYIGFTEATDLIRNKQLDGAWIMSGIPTAAVTEMTSTANSKVIPMDESLIEKLKEKYPWYSNYTIPAGTYENQEEDILTSAIKMALFTTESMDEDLIYEITKTFWENIDELKVTNNSLRDLNVEDAIENIGNLKLHPGAIKYYKEIGIMD